MSQQLQKRAELPVMGMLGKYKDQIEAIIPAHLTPTRMMKLVVGAFNQNSDLLMCKPISIVNAVVTAASLGLEIRPRSAYLVPFNTKDGWICQLFIDYRGKTELAMRSNLVAAIPPPRIVHAHDVFHLRDTLAGTDLLHEPLLFKMNGKAMERISEADRGPMILVYATAKMKSGESVLEYMTFEQVEVIRKRSKMGNRGPWIDDREQMDRKTVLHRLCNYLPSSPELEKSQDIDDAFETGRPLPPAFEFEPEDLNQGPIIEQSEEKAGQVAAAKTASVKQKAKTPAPPPPREPGDDDEQDEEPDGPPPPEEEHPQRQATSSRSDPRLVFPGRS